MLISRRTNFFELPARINFGNIDRTSTASNFDDDDDNDDDDA